MCPSIYLNIISIFTVPVENKVQRRGATRTIYRCTVMLITIVAAILQIVLRLLVFYIIQSISFGILWCKYHCAHELNPRNVDLFLWFIFCMHNYTELYLLLLSLSPCLSRDSDTIKTLTTYR